MLDWESIGTGIGAIGVVILTVIGTVRGNLKSTGKPPADRAPAPHETKAEIAALRHDLTVGLKLIDEALRRIERSNGTLAEGHRELRRLLIDVDHEVQKLT